MADIVKWLIVAWLAIGALLTIGSIGKPRKPIEPSTAVIGAVLTTGIIVAVIAYWPSS
jgi:hypothetical protein